MHMTESAKKENSATKSFKFIKNLIFPMGTYCICCGNLIDEKRTYCLCDHCVRHFDWGLIKIDLKKQEEESPYPLSLDSVIGCMKYGIYERRLIFTLKYNKATYVARILAEIMYDRIKIDEEVRKKVETLDYIVPVPISRGKLKQRGFNQTEKIGKHFSRLVKIPQENKFLIRTKDTKPQRALSKEERFFNLKGVFQVPEYNKAKLRDKRIILIDDVYTTGATGNLCAQALKDSGAKSVDLMVIATGSKYLKRQ